jgi:hypothetical protein
MNGTTGAILTGFVGGIVAAVATSTLAMHLLVGVTVVFAYLLGRAVSGAYK